MVAIPKEASLFGDLDVQASGAMTSFTIDIDIGERGGIDACLGVEIFLQVGAVTSGAVCVPALADPRPV